MRSLLEDFIYPHYSLTSSSSLGGGYLVKLWAPVEASIIYKVTCEWWPFKCGLAIPEYNMTVSLCKTPNIHWIITCPSSYFPFLCFLQHYSFKNFLSNHFLLNSLQSSVYPQHSIKIIPLKVTSELKMSDQKVNSVFILSKSSVACDTLHSLVCETWFLRHPTFLSLSLLASSTFLPLYPSLPLCPPGFTLILLFLLSSFLLWFS